MYLYRDGTCLIGGSTFHSLLVCVVLMLMTVCDFIQPVNFDAAPRNGRSGLENVWLLDIVVAVGLTQFVDLSFQDGLQEGLL